MKLHIASDLHLEFLEPHFPGYRVVDPVPDSDVLVLAGDIHAAAKAVHTFADFGKPVIYVPGNHEFYGSDFEWLRRQLREASAGTNVHVLDDSAVVIGDVRFLGSTMWTDYKLMPGISQRRQMLGADAQLADRRCIVKGASRFTAEDALAVHTASRHWLKEQLSEPFDGRTVVVTHHGCSAKSTAPRFNGNALNGAFMSNLEDLVEQADLWIHGHIHDTVRYQCRGTPVVANPRGYALNLATARAPTNLGWENPSFIPDLVVEV